MSATTVQFLARRLSRAHQRWDDAMRRPGYRDDPFEADDEGVPFTEVDWQLYAWADAWRDAVHALEKELFAIPDVARAITEAKAQANNNPQIVFVREESVANFLQAQGKPAMKPAKPPTRKK